MVTVDAQFLTVHPRTALWWAQREQCLKCLYSEHYGMPGINFGALRCTVTPVRMGPMKAAGQGAYCIDAREVGMPCGPLAKRFKSDGSKT